MLLSAVMAIPVVLVLLFVLVYWLPDMLLHVAEDALGTRVINSLFGIASVVAGVLLGARLWYVTSTRGRQGTRTGVLLAIVAPVGLILAGVWFMIA